MSTTFSQNTDSKSQNGWYEEEIDVTLIFSPKCEHEFLQKIKVFRNTKGDIDFTDLLRSLKGMAFPLEGNVISYYSFANDMFIYCGHYPLPANFTVPASEIYYSEGRRQVSIRARQVFTNRPSMPINSEAALETDNIKLEGTINFAEQGSGNTKQERTKERRIGEILDKVRKWRRLYTGVVDPKTGQTVKLSLEEAAKRVGISKKSLDDYLLQIRLGKKHGFSFGDHFNDKFSVLRTFVKKQKEGKKGDKDDGDDDLDDDIKAESAAVGKKPEKN